MQYPKSISPCPIIEGVFEIKFNSNIPQPAILGMVFNEFKQEYPLIENLPASQIPKEIINSDPNLKFKAFHKLVGNNYIILVGYDVIAITVVNSYKGWGDFKPQIIRFINGLQNIGLIASPISGILRYINLFEGDIYANINLSITLNSSPIVSSNSQVRFESNHEKYIKTLQISNNVSYSTDPTQQRLGSIIDVSVSTFQQDLMSDKFESTIEEMHTIEKSTFFELLKEPFIQTLSPVYS